MRVFRPADRIYFGKHAGHTLCEIYRFFPTYIEFLVEYIPGFIIDETEFVKLPRPMPYIAVFELSKKGKINILNANSITRTYQYLRDGFSMPEVPFRFRKKTLQILDMKRKGIYKTPVWKKTDAVLMSFPSDELIKKMDKVLN